MPQTKSDNPYGAQSNAPVDAERANKAESKLAQTKPQPSASPELTDSGEQKGYDDKALRRRMQRARIAQVRDQLRREKVRRDVAEAAAASEVRKQSLLRLLSILLSVVVTIALAHICCTERENERPLSMDDMEQFRQHLYQSEIGDTGLSLEELLASYSDVSPTDAPQE